MTATQIIDFAELTENGQVANLSGRHRGLAAREKYHLDWESEKDVRDLEVIVPGTLDSVTPSFIQGMFGRALEVMGSDETSFFNRIHFQADAYIVDQIRMGVSALRTSRDLKDLF